MKIPCPQCQNAGRQNILSELHKHVNEQTKLVMARMICNTCGFAADAPVVQESPPCERCGHITQRYMKGDPRGGLLGTPSNEEVFNALRSGHTGEM